MTLPDAIPCRHRSDWRRCSICRPAMTPGRRSDARGAMLGALVQIVVGLALVVAGSVLP